MRAGRSHTVDYGHWKMALCSLSIRTMVAPCAGFAHQQFASQCQRFLVGQQRALAGWAAANVGGQASGTDDRRHHGVASTHPRPMRPALRCQHVRVADPHPLDRRATRRNRTASAITACSGDACGTAPAVHRPCCRCQHAGAASHRMPIRSRQRGGAVEPVAPSTATRCIVRTQQILQREHQQRHSTCPPGQHAAVAGNPGCQIFTSAWRLSRLFSRSRRRRGTTPSRLPPAPPPAVACARANTGAPQMMAHQHGQPDAAGHAFRGLVGTDTRGQLAPPDHCPPDLQ